MPIYFHKDYLLPARRSSIITVNKCERNVKLWRPLNGAIAVACEGVPVAWCDFSDFHQNVWSKVFGEKPLFRIERLIDLYRGRWPPSLPQSHDTQNRDDKDVSLIRMVRCSWNSRARFIKIIIRNLSRFFSRQKFIISEVAFCL